MDKDCLRETMKLLVEHRAEVHHVCQDESTAMLHAAALGHIPAMEAVFEALAGKTCDYGTVLDDPPSIPALRG